MSPPIVLVLANELASQIELVDKLESDVRQETAGLVEFPRSTPKGG